MAVTHEVVNQPPPMVGRNIFTDNVPLVEAIQWTKSAGVVPTATELGAVLGTADMAELAARAHDHPPVLRTHDRVGHRIDEIDFDPAWHTFMDLAVSHGVHASPWQDPGPGAHARRAVLFSLLAQTEPGHGCPISMTYSSVPTLALNPELMGEWGPKITASVYDPGLRPPADKRGVLLGMAMTEKQGGSDVRAGTTSATPVSDGYLLRGHKWFCSAPMSDAFLVLAQAPGGLTCFLLPRVLPDGTRNGIRFQRLKDKLGNRSNASAEPEFIDALAQRVGEEGRGVRTIIEMVNHTRLDCVIGSTAGMRQGVAEALWHARHRNVFGRRLWDQPLMRQVLADLCLEAEAATVTMMRLASAYDAETDAPFRRLATAVVKYWVCKRGSAHSAEALECLGGNGYIEEFPLARRYREQPLMSIWEGSGNVISLDVLRAMATEPATVDAFLTEVEIGTGIDPTLDALTASLRKRLGQHIEQSQARKLTEDLALALQASLLWRYAPEPVAAAFSAARLSNDRGLTYGDLPDGVDTAAIMERHLPE